VVLLGLGSVPHYAPDHPTILSSFSYNKDK
jgi:hypothetical protein